MRLCQTGQLERQRVGDSVQAARGNLHVRRHRAVDAVAEAFPLRAQIVAAGLAQQTVATHHGGRFRHDTVTFAERLYRASGLCDGSGELVAEDDGDVDRPRMRVVRLVHVGSADRYRPDPQQDVAVADVGDGDVPKFDGQGLERVVDDSRLHLVIW